MCALFTGSQTFKLKYLEITKNTFMHFYQSTHDIVDVKRNVCMTLPFVPVLLVWHNFMIAEAYSNII